jgi:hypothetical protein
LGYDKAIAAIARKLLIAVWYALQRKADKFAESKAVAQHCRFTGPQPSSMARHPTENVLTQ